MINSLGRYTWSFGALELVQYADSECQACFNANEMVISAPLEHSSEESQVISLDNICMVDGSWTFTTQFSGCGWVWKDCFRKIQLMGMQNLMRWPFTPSHNSSSYFVTYVGSVRDWFTLGSRSTVMSNGEHATTLTMSELWDILQGSDRDDKWTSSLAKF